MCDRQSVAVMRDVWYVGELAIFYFFGPLPKVCSSSGTGLPLVTLLTAHTHKFLLGGWRKPVGVL